MSGGAARWCYALNLFEDFADERARRRSRTLPRAMSCRSPKAAPGGAYFLSNVPVSAALASVLKCSWKPTIAADVSAFTGNASSFTANTVNA